MAKIQEHANTTPEAENRWRIFTLYTAQNDEKKNCFSANVSEYNIRHCVVQVQLCS